MTRFSTLSFEKCTIFRHKIDKNEYKMTFFTKLFGILQIIL